MKAGSLLFEIDPRPYQALYDQAESQVGFYKAQRDLADVTSARDEQLAKTTPGAVSACNSTRTARRSNRPRPRSRSPKPV